MTNFDMESLGLLDERSICTHGLKDTISEKLGVK